MEVALSEMFPSIGSLYEDTDLVRRAGTSVTLPIWEMRRENVFSVGPISSVVMVEWPMKSE
jgi:hypothetical protein